MTAVLSAGIVIGVFIGTCLGVGIMCIVYIGRSADEIKQVER